MAIAALYVIVKPETHQMFIDWGMDILWHSHTMEFYKDFELELHV